MDGVIISGPLFDGRASAAATRAAADIQRQVAAAGEKLAHAAFASSIQDGTGAFLGSITTVTGGRTFTTAGKHGAYTMTATADLATDGIVTTDQAAYGPWLEGVGSRNETTRFKGYHGFRMAAQQLDAAAGAIAAAAVAPFAEEMNL